MPNGSDDTRSGQTPLPSAMGAIPKLVLGALFALTLSFLTFAASFADVPRSEYAPLTTLSD